MSARLSEYLETDHNRDKPGGLQPQGAVYPRFERADLGLQIGFRRQLVAIRAYGVTNDGRDRLGLAFVEFGSAKRLRGGQGVEGLAYGPSPAIGDSRGPRAVFMCAICIRAPRIARAACAP